MHHNTFLVQDHKGAAYTMYRSSLSANEGTENIVQAYVNVILCVAKLRLTSVETIISLFYMVLCA